jgi:hypothetical protein
MSFFVFLAADVPQLSDAWWAVRRGVPTASCFDQIMTPVKGELAKTSEIYIAELLSEIVCHSPNYFTEKGTPANSYAIQNGVQMEPEARRWLAMEANLDVTEVGFCLSSDMRFGCSPDGLLGLQYDSEPAGELAGYKFYKATAEAAVELKCPLLKTHMGYLLAGGLPPQYRPQCNGHLVVLGVPRCEFVSYSNSIQPLRVSVVHDEWTIRLRTALNLFHDRFQTAKARVAKLVGEGEPPP